MLSDHPLPAILGAVGREFRPLNTAVHIERQHRIDTCSVRLVQYKGRSALFVLTGVGPSNAAVSVRALLDVWHVSLLLSIGYAGAVQEGLNVGDVIGVDALRRAAPNWRGPIQPAGAGLFRSDAALLQGAECAARELGISWRRGASLTVPEVIAQPATKRWIGEMYGVDCVEMESAVIAEAAVEHGLRHATLRAVSDAIDDEVPSSPWFNSAAEEQSASQSTEAQTRGGSSFEKSTASAAHRACVEAELRRGLMANTELASANLGRLVLRLLEGRII